MTTRRTNTNPMRNVVAAHWGSGSSGMGSQRFAVRWWELELQCGHTVERPARSVPGASRGKRGFMLMHHPVSDKEENFRPASTRVRCEVCGQQPQVP